MNLNIMTVKAKVMTATELITPISAGYWAGVVESGAWGGCKKSLNVGWSWFLTLGGGTRLC